MLKQLKRNLFLLTFALLFIFLMPVKVFANEKLPSPTGVKWGLTCPGSVYACWDDLDNDNVDEILIKEYKDGVYKAECIVSAQELNYPSVSFPQLSAEETDTFSVTFRDSTGMYEDSDEIFSDILDTSWLSQKMPNPTNLRWENNSGSYFSIWEYPYEGNGSKFVINLYEDGVLFETFEADGWNLSTGYWFWLRGDYENHEYTYGVKAVDEYGSFEDSDEVISEPADISVIKELWGDYREISIYYDANGGTKGDYWVEKDNTMPCALGTENSLCLVLLEESSYVGVDRVLPPEGKKFAGFEIGGIFYPVGEPIEISFGDDIVWKYIWEDDSTEKEQLPSPTNLTWSSDGYQPCAIWSWSDDDYAKLSTSSVKMSINYYEDGELVDVVSHDRDVYGDYEIDTVDNAFMLFVNTDFRNHSYSYGIVLTDLSGQYADSEEVFSDEIDFEWINTYYNNFLINDNEGRLKTTNWIGWKKVYWDGDSQKFTGIATSWFNNESFDDCYRNDNCSTIINLYEDGSIIKTYTVDGMTIGRSIEHDILLRDYEGHIYEFGLIKRDNSGRYADSEEVFSDPLDNEWISELKELIVLHDIYYDANGGEVQTWIGDVKGFSVVDGKVVLKLDSFHSIYDTGVNGYGSISSKVYQDFITPPVGKIFKGFEIDGKLYQCEEEYEASIPADGHILIKCIWDDDPNWVEPTLDGLVDVNGILKYYKKGVLQDSYTGLLQSNNVWYYVQKGVVEKGVNTLVNYGGTWYYVKDSVVDFGFTGIFEYGGTDYYIQKGSIKWGINGLTNIGGTWFNLSNSAVNKGYTGLVQYSGNWYYVQKGQLIWGVDTLVQYNGTWYYVNNSTLDWNYTGIVPYMGTDYYVQKGAIKWGVNGLTNVAGTWYNLNNSAVNKAYTGLVQYGGNWYYVNKGVLDWNYTGIVTYGGTDYYVQKGQLRWGVNGLTSIGGVWYNLSNSAVNKGYTGLVQYSGNWYYVQKGQLIWGVNTLVQYNGTWYYVNNSTLDWNYTGIVPYMGTDYYVQKGAIKWGVNGLTNVAGTWYNLNNSAVNKAYTGLVQYGGTWYYVNKGVLDWNHTGIVTYGGTDYYVQKGQLRWGVNGLTSIGGIWYNLSNSAVNKGYTGLVQYSGNWYYVQKGQLIWGVNTLVQYNGTWYYVNNSTIDWNYTGLVPYNGSLYYVQRGTLIWGYNGTVQYNGKMYNVVNSTAK